ncbi:hypothetical protein NHQ30_000655 [Ciborinia camelliae]|nr:hypothetical protein NHQ30_000655 [Ciborinia camelliae]
MLSRSPREKFESAETRNWGPGKISGGSGDRTGPGITALCYRIHILLFSVPKEKRDAIHGVDTPRESLILDASERANLAKSPWKSAGMSVDAMILKLVLVM